MKIGLENNLLNLFTTITFLLKLILQKWRHMAYTLAHLPNKINKEHMFVNITFMYYKLCNE